MFRLVLVASAFLALVPGLGAVEWVSKIDISSQEDQRLVETLPARGFVPIFSKESFNQDNQSRFDVVYLKLSDVTWEYRKYNDADFRRRDLELRAMGYELVSHQSYTFNGVFWHNCIWHKNR